MASSSQPSPQRPSAGSDASNKGSTPSTKIAKPHSDEISAAELLEIGAKSLQTGAATGNDACTIKQLWTITN